MHEGSFTEQIVSHILRELSGHPQQKVRSVTVKVGEVFHLVPDSVLMHYHLLTRGSNLKDVQLHLKEVPVEVLCSDCHKQGPVEDHHLLMCSFCHSRRVKTVAGDQITIDHIELEKI